MLARTKNAVKSAVISHAPVINFHSTTVIKKEHGIKLSIGAKKRERRVFCVLNFSVGDIFFKKWINEKTPKVKDN